MPPSETLLSEQAAFAKHLFTQGYPLWSPDPVLLPADDQIAGLQIGDVGTIDERGRFDLFFNILHPPPGSSDSPPLNIPLSVENDARRVDEDILPREVVSSPDTPWEVDQLDVLTVSNITRRTTEYGSTLTDDGAHIIVPQGAQCYEVRHSHKGLFENYAREHGVEWIRRFQDRLGRPRSTSLYLLTGFYRTCSWSLASFSMRNAANTHPVHVRCTLAEVDEQLIQVDSTWQPAGRFKHKIGPPPNRQGRNNQTIFIRGITITPRDSMQGEGEKGYAGLLSILSAPTRFLSTLAGHSLHQTKTDAAESSVIIQHVPQISHVSHPSEIINQYLLAKEPSANIAVTHDNQWIAMLEFLEEGQSWNLEDLENHLEALVPEHYSVARHNDAVYLRDKEHGSLARFGVDRSCLPNDLASCITANSNPFAYGTFWNVYSGTLRTPEGSIKVAIKVFTASLNEVAGPQKTTQRLRHQFKMWSTLDHINVLPVIGTTMSFGQSPAMVSPWAQHGTLKFYLESQSHNLTNTQILSMNHDIASGLHYLHSKGIVHGSLSGNNVLVDADGRALLADFGLSTMAEELGWKKSVLPVHDAVDIDSSNREDPKVPATMESDILDFSHIMLQILLADDPYNYYVFTQTSNLASLAFAPGRPNNQRVTDGRWSFIQRCRSRVSLRPSSGELVEFTRNELAEVDGTLEVGEKGASS